MEIITNHKVNAEKALKALRNVVDPELQLNVADLGLIYQLDFDDIGKQLFCTMTLTTRFCPMGESITRGVNIALSDVFPEYKILISVTFTPPWKPEMISEEGRIFLNK